MQLSIFSSQDFPASLSASPDCERAWMIRVATSCSPSLQLLADTLPAGWYGRTSPVCCHRTADGILAPSSGGWQNSGMGSPTGFLTLSSSAWPSDAAVCSLSDVLETGDHLRRYCLSARACLGHPAPRREARQDVAPTLAARTRGGGGLGTDVECGGGLIPEVAHALTARNERIDAQTETLLVAHALRSDGFDASEDGTGRGTPLVPYAIQAGTWRENPGAGPDGIGVQAEIAYALEARAEVQAVAFDCKASARNGVVASSLAPTLRGMTHAASHANGGGHAAVVQPLTLAIRGRCDSRHLEVRDDDLANALVTANGGRDGIGVGALMTPAMQVRRLTPRECERLMGFPDDYTLVPYRGKPAADGPRYRALGNSIAVPVLAWIGRRIAVVDAVLELPRP